MSSSEELDVIIVSCIFSRPSSYGLIKKWLLSEFDMRPFCQNQLKSVLAFDSKTLMILLKSCSQIYGVMSSA